MPHLRVHSSLLSLFWVLSPTLRNPFSIIFNRFTPLLDPPVGKCCLHHYSISVPGPTSSTLFLALQPLPTPQPQDFDLGHTMSCKGAGGEGAGDKKVEEEDTRIWFCFSGLSLCLQKHQNLWWSSKGSSLTPNLLPFAESTDLFIKIVQRFQKWWNPWPGLIFLLITMAKSGQDKKEMVLKALESDHNQQKLEGNLLLRVEL